MAVRLSFTLRGHVLCVAQVSKIGKPVIGRVAVDMVNVQAFPVPDERCRHQSV
jgi:hypothetical protein